MNEKNIGFQVFLLGIHLHNFLTSFVTSFYFNRRFAIHGRNVHLPASMKKKLTWFVYLATDTACLLQYVGSTMDACSRFSSTKNACLNRKSTNTGLYKHFAEGCPTALLNGDVRHLTWTLIDFMVTSEEKLADASHGGGVACRCSECQRLKDIEDLDLQTGNIQPSQWSKH